MWYAAIATCVCVAVIGDAAAGQRDPKDGSPLGAPLQDRWRIYGVSLPNEVLRKLYHENALKPRVRHAWRP